MHIYQHLTRIIAVYLSKFCVNNPCSFIEILHENEFYRFRFRRYFELGEGNWFFKRKFHIM